ncbi:hypothetical protein QBC45DRAFT_168757 [Copromyces sp. CBS 386.78]|nr:hypothetical protein QBC45DRAFT_168757 [Copromyces sp. CBS 386.78]
MGGKQWTKQEELVFWKEVVPRSPKRVGKDRQRHEMHWRDCATWMQRRMAREFREPRRTYTELCLFEHYFQNAEKQKFSPHAELLVRRYLRQKAQDGASDVQGNVHGNGETNEAGDSDFNRDMEQAPQPPETLGSARSQIPVTPVRPRNLGTKRTKDSDHQVASPSSMSPFVPGYNNNNNNNSDGFAGIGSQASTPSYTGYTGHLHQPRSDREPLGPSGMSTAPTMPMAPMDEVELPSLAGLHAVSPFGNDSPVTPGQYSEVNSSPPIQMPQPMRHQSAIERQAASAGMSVQDLLNSSPAKQHPLPQAYQGPVNNGYGFQSGYNYHPNYVQGLDQRYGNGYSQNYTSNYGSPYGQGYNNGVQNYNQGYDSSPQGLNNGVQNYNQGFDSSPQESSNGAQNYNQGYDSSPQFPQGRNQDEPYATRALSSNATRSAHESEVHSDERHGHSSDNNYQNSGSPTEDYQQLPIFNGRGPQKSMNRV